MHARFVRHVFVAFVTAAASCGAFGCGPGAPSLDGGGGADAMDPVPAGAECTAATDPDHDGIPAQIEGGGDADGDGLPNWRDPDADGDTIPDRVESVPRADRPACVVHPVDSDRDRLADFLDTDSNNDGLSDGAQVAPSPGQPGTAPAGGWTEAPYDTDGDGAPDYIDPDADGDTVRNEAEVPGGATPDTAADTNGDGLPDYRDLDSDGDTIADRDEGAGDRDRDGTPNFRDPDADGDSVTDRDEAGRAERLAPPGECARELDAATLASAHPDGIPDFLDLDSDNDGLLDRDEITAGSDRCNPDTNGNGTLDSVDAAYCRNHTRTGCATDPAFRIPATDYYVILPDGARARRELEFGTTIQTADVFFLSDTTGSMTEVLDSIRGSIATPGEGLVDRVRALIPDVWFGVGHYEDFPAPPHGAPTDRVFHPPCRGRPGSSPEPWCTAARYGGIAVSANAADVQAAAQAIPAGEGGDSLSTSVEALYQLVTGEGLYDPSRASDCASAPGVAQCWVPPATGCPPGRFGWGCFRRNALPIVVHYSDTQSHWGSRNPGATSYNNQTVGIAPRPHDADEMTAAFRAAGARMISLNAFFGANCAGARPVRQPMLGPCYDFLVWSEATGSLNLDGQPYIFDIAIGDAESVLSAVARGVREITTRSVIDVSTLLENDPTNPRGFDATQFIVRRVPSCRVGAAPTTDCWTEPAGTPHAAAVARTDGSTLYRVLPGTRVRFTVDFANDDVFPGDPTQSTLFHAYIHVVGDEAGVLDTHEVYILVPVRATEQG